READRGAKAMEGLEDWRPHLVLCAVRAPGTEGTAELRAIRARTVAWRAAIVATTCSALEEAAHALIEAGANSVLREPCLADDVLHQIHRELGVEYVFSGAPAPVPVAEAADPTAIRAEHVSRLPPALVDQFRDAARAADYDHFAQLLETIPKEHAALAGALRGLLEQFAYEQIEAVLKP